MARAHGIFNLSGKVGDKVYRMINGKCYVANAPTHYTMPQTPEAILRREKFLLCRKICSAIDKLFYSKMLWRIVVPKKANRLGYMMKSIYPIIVKYNIDLLGIVPHPDLITNCLECSYANERIKLKFAPFDDDDNKILLNSDTAVAVEGVLYLCDAGSQRKDKFNLIPLISADKLLVLNQEIELEFNLTGLQLEALNLYPERKLYVVLIIKNTLNEHSNTIKDLYCRVSKTFQFEI